MTEQATVQQAPAHAARLLAPGERVCYLTRPRLMPLRMLGFMTTVVLAVVAFSVLIRDPGFLGLLSIPALPVIGGIGGYLLHSPVILVTDRRVMSARRFVKPLSLDLGKLEKMQVRQTMLERMLHYGTLHLLFPHPEEHGEGVFLCYSLERLPDAAALASAVATAATALKNTNGPGLPEPTVNASCG